MTVSKQIKRKLAAIIVAITVIVGMFFANPARFNKASAAENEYSFVLDDLKRDSSFYVSNYSKTSKGSSWYLTCSVIAVAESINKELFIYVYDSAGQTLSFKDVRMKESDATNFYKLETVSRSVRFYKLLVKDFKVSDEVFRNYKIDGINIESTAETFLLNRIWTIKTEGNITTCETNKGTTLSLGLIGQDLSGVTEVHTAVLDDLKKASDFNQSDFVKKNPITLDIITLAESKDDELFVYCYHSQGVSVDALKAQELYISFTDGSGTSYKYRLQFINYNETLAKYRVEKYSVKSDTKRVYNVISITDGQPESYPIGKVWTFQSQANGTTALTVSTGKAYYLGKLASCHVGSGGTGESGSDSPSQSESGSGSPSQSETSKDLDGSSVQTSSKGKIILAVFGSIAFVAAIAGVISYILKKKDGKTVKSFKFSVWFNEKAQSVKRFFSSLFKKKNKNGNIKKSKPKKKFSLKAKFKSLKDSFLSLFKRKKTFKPAKRRA